MSEPEIELEPPPSGRRWWLSFFSSASVGLPLLVFILGVMTGFPLAIFGFDFLVANAALAFAVLFGILFLLTMGGMAVIAFRKPIWRGLFKVGEVELHRIAEPIGDVVRLTSERRIPEATVAAGELARFVMARYAWIATRRWIVGAVTGFVAVIAALAGSALLFQQNQLLRIQGDLMQQQTERLTEQTLMLETQIQIGEAQRSTAIIPEIISIGASISDEIAKMPGVVPVFLSTSLTQNLRNRIIAATAAARPYRYLRYGLDALSLEEMIAATIADRTDLTVLRQQIDDAMQQRETLWGVKAAQITIDSGALADRLVSPERGQLLAMLYSAGVLDIDRLSFDGADFAFAEVRAPILAGMSLKHGYFPYADFSQVVLNDMQFGGARLDQARFRGSRIVGARFASIPNDQVEAPFAASTGGGFQFTRLIGTDFRLGRVFECDFGHAMGIGANFDGAAVFATSFVGAVLGGATFRNAILYAVAFDAAELGTTDFDGAVVTEADFLDRLQVQALAGSFDPAKYEIAPLSEDDLSTHPNLEALGELPADPNRQYFRLKRIAPLETLAAEVGDGTT